MKPVEKLMEAYACDVRTLLALARSIVCDASEAEDVLQDVMVRLLSEPDKYGKVKNPHAFLRTCVRNEAVDHVRRLGRSTPAPDELLSLVRETVSENEFKRVENMMWLQSYLDPVEPEVREAFIRVTVDGHTIASAAKQLGIPEDTLRKRFNAIKKRMRQDRFL